MRPFFLLPALSVLPALPAFAEPPAIIADIPATGALVQQVLGDLGEVRVLLASGANAHSYQLRPSDAGALQDADLLVWVGPELTPWLQRSATSLTQATSLQLLALPETTLREFEDEDPHEGEDDGHDHHLVDPHAWLDPANGKLWLAAIARTLAEADPDNAATYAANAEAGAKGIDAAVTALTAQLAPIAQDRIAVFHDAYGYFTSAFGLQPAIAVALGDAATPSAARLNTIRDEMAAESVRCAFPEAGQDPALIASMVEGSDIRIGEALDPSGVDLEAGPQLYTAILETMATTIQNCLDGEA